MKNFLTGAIHVLLSIIIAFAAGIIIKLISEYFNFEIRDITIGIVIGMVYIECLYNFKRWVIFKK